MCSKRLIQIQGLGKKYWVKSASFSLREELMCWLKTPWERRKKEEFWALKNLNLSINRGESVGIVGANGSGKSTLLKILSRITWPTTGRIEIEGRVSALLEVGTGFHGDLSGFENIFLSGALLGMKRSEVRASLEEIIAFSEVEPFIHTPIKKYSSGMLLRLGFAVMAYLESDILVLDEILSVGDASFQEKSFQKIRELVSRGRTVILVSHELEKLRSLCSRIIWIDRGSLVADGPPDEILPRFLDHNLITL